MARQTNWKLRLAKYHRPTALIETQTRFKSIQAKPTNWKNIDLKGNLWNYSSKVNSVQNWDISGLVLDAIELVRKKSQSKLNAC